MSKRILINKIALMHGKGDFSKIKRRICNRSIFLLVPIEAGIMCNVLPRPAVSYGLIVFKLK